MDVTPSPKMFSAMQQFIDALCGEEPNKLMVGPGAQAVRDRRVYAMDILHQLVGLAMREGVNRKVLELKADREGGVFDAADRRAKEQARADAEAGRLRVILPK